MPAAEQIQEIPLAKIFVSERNTRQPKPTDPDVVELAASIKARGQITAGLARPHPKKKGCFELAAGARRRIANEVAEKPTMKIVVREMDDDELDEIILVENFQRLDPSPYAEAELIGRMVKRGTTTPAAIAAACGRPESWAVRRLRLLDVIPAIFKMWEPGKRLAHFSVEMMEFVGSLPVATQENFAKEHNRGWNAGSRKELEAAFAEATCSLDKAPFDLTDPATFVDGCGPGCANDSAKAGNLFDFDKGKCGHCLVPTCFFARLAKARQAEYDALCGGKKLEVVAEKYMGSIRIGNERINPDYGEYSVGKLFKNEPTNGGGKKVICILSNGKMAIRYAVKTSSSHGGPSKVPKSDKEKRAEKIALLQSKRWIIVRADLVKALNVATVADLTMDIVDLVAGIGLPYKLESDRYHANTRLWKILDHRIAGFPSFKESGSYYTESEAKAATAPRNEVLWSGAKALLLRLIPEPARTSDMVNYAPNLQGIAGLIKYPIDSKKREADLQVLPPKSWGPTDPHTLKPLGKAAAAAKPPVPTVKAKPETKAGKGNWIEVGVGKSKKPAKTAAKAKKKVVA